MGQSSLFRYTDTEITTSRHHENNLTQNIKLKTQHKNVEPAGSTFLHCENIETAINNGYSTCDELRRVRHEIMNGAAEFLRVTHPAVWCLVYHILAALGV